MDAHACGCALESALPKCARERSRAERVVAGVVKGLLYVFAFALLVSLCEALDLPRLVKEAASGSTVVLTREDPSDLVLKALEQCEEKDARSLAAFERELTGRLERLEASIDPFLDNLWSLDTLWKTATFQRQKHVEALWRKYFGDSLQAALDASLAGLTVKLQANRNAASAVVYLKLGDEVGREFDRRLALLARDIFDTAGHQASLSATNMAIAGEVMAFAAGGYAGAVAGSWAGSVVGGPVGAAVGVAVGLGADLTVSWLTEKATKEACRDKLQAALRQSARELTYGSGSKQGLMPILRQEMERLHQARLTAAASNSAHNQGGRV